MAIFRPKAWVMPLRKMTIFRLFQLLDFIGQKAFFRSRIWQKTYSWSILPKKKVGKMAILGPKPWVNPLEKCQFFYFFNFLFLQARKAFFSFQNIVKDIFLVYIPKKKKVGKLAVFGPKPWVKPFRKMSIFPLLELLVFIAQKGIFSFQNIVKDIFLVYIAKKK